MTTAAMRAQLIEFLSGADEKKIAGLYALLEENIQEKKSPALTEEQINFLNGERKKHLAGESKSYSWDEVKEMVRKKKAS